MPKAEKEAETEEPEFRISLYDLASTNEKTKKMIKTRLRRKKSRVKKMNRNNVLKRSCRKMKDSCSCCSWEGARNFLKRMFPFLSILKGYSALYDLPCDIIAGLTVGIMHIPQGKWKRRLCVCVCIRKSKSAGGWGVGANSWMVAWQLCCGWLVVSAVMLRLVGCFICLKKIIRQKQDEVS